MLPWLSHTLNELRTIQRNIEISGLVMQRLAAHRRRATAATIDKDMRMAEKAIAGGRRRIRELLVEVTGRGIELRDMSYGLVDFPGLRDGKLVWLCWRLDELEVAHWHDLDTGFANRQPL